MVTAYYNEFDSRAAAWLRQLIKNGDITPGEVDERSITEVSANDIVGFDRVHFFAGVGTWDYCLNQAGWGDRPIWTASLPCQPFSAAGKGLGKSDERHLLPHFLELVRRCKPATIFGEQVERAIGSTGLRTEVEDLQLLQERQAYLRVLAELQRSCSEGLRNLPIIGESQEKGAKEGKFGIVSEMEDREQREGFSKHRSVSVERKRNAFGHNSGVGATKDRCRGLRGDRNNFRLRDTESLERAIIGQDRQQPRLSKIEHQSGDLCPECDDEYMGSAEDIGSIEWNYEAAKDQINRSYREISEQLEKALAHGWLDDLQTNMEAEGYAVGHCVLGAHSISAAHIRQRLYWVADAVGQRREQQSDMQPTRIFGEKIQQGEQVKQPCDMGAAPSGMGNTKHKQHKRGISRPGQELSENCQRSASESSGSGEIGRMGITDSTRPQQGSEAPERTRYGSAFNSASGIDWLYCRDKKYRPVKSGIKPLVDGSAGRMVHSSDPSAPINANDTPEARVMRLKGYGNAIQAQTAMAFITAFMSI